MRVQSAIPLCAAVAGTAAFQQIPIVASDKQAPLQASSGEEKPLVESSALQDLITGDRLEVRAKRLYDIAKLGEHEYNHPTRVIGSAGRFSLI